MVKIAVAGGTGQVAREVIDALLESGKHDITILSRTAHLTEPPLQGIRFQVVNYDDHANLVEILKGTHTLLSFLQLLSDPDAVIQKKIIDAAVAAGVKRFAPSEYGSASIMHMPWWMGKTKTREYLEEINKEAKYTLFQPGLFLDYLAFPHKTAKHIDPLQTVFDFENCRAIVVAGHEDAVMTLTSPADLAAVITLAVDHEDVWPEISGISGNKMTFLQITQLGEKIRGIVGPCVEYLTRLTSYESGRTFEVDKVNLEDLQAGVLNTSWGLQKRHQAVSECQHEQMVRQITIGMLLSGIQGAWDVSTEMNKLFPEHHFDKAESFLRHVWK